MSAGRSVAEGLALVRAKVAALAKEVGGNPRLVAVSKIMPVEVVMEAYREDQRHFGENYVQEVCEKAPKMPSDIKWHFIGNLQSNKAKTLVKEVPNLFVVESVDSVKIATALDKACVSAGRKELLNVMVQVNTSQEESKSGCEATEATTIASHITADCKRLKLVGLMTIGKLGDPNPEPYFKQLATVRSEVEKALSLPANSLELSMGMSGDYELAIRMGSTNVRVGSTIFGARPKKDAPPAAGGEGGAGAGAGAGSAGGAGVLKYDGAGLSWLGGWQGAAAITALAAVTLALLAARRA